MTTTTRYNDWRVLASGALVDVDPDTGAASFVRCPWLIQVPNGNPEPDFPEDCYDIVECGALLRFDAPEGERCDHGHEFGNMERRCAPGGPEWQRDQMERAVR
jgi:hypothetical protein